MTPKEKAEELYLKYKDALNIRNDMRPGANPFAKQCALIAVEEILAINYNIRCDAGERLVAQIKDYYEEVKTEIVKL